MNGKALYRALGEIDLRIVSEAADPCAYAKRRRAVQRILAAAACLVLLTAALLVRPWSQSVQSSGTPCTLQSLSEEYGYDMAVPADAQDVAYAAVRQAGEIVGQASFVLNGQEYCYRTLRTETPQNISDVRETLQVTETCTLYGQDVTIERGGEDTYVLSWYDAKNQQQYSLSAQSAASAEDMKATAEGIMELLGYEMEAAPEGAEDVTYGVFTGGINDPRNGAELTFTYEGVHYCFRTLGTDGMKNISDVEKAWQTEKTVKLTWCQAKLSYDEGQDGLILWYDAAPGLLYSLYMDDGASETALTDMALLLYQPMQDDTE